MLGPIKAIFSPSAATMGVPTGHSLRRTTELAANLRLSLRSSSRFLSPGTSATLALLAHRTNLSMALARSSMTLDVIFRDDTETSASIVRHLGGPDISRSKPASSASMTEYVPNL